MVKHILPALCALTAIAAAPPVRTMYTDATAKEQAVRKAMAAPDATDAMLKAVHEAVATYEAVVKRYPVSSYSDNALWQAGNLAFDAFSRFNQAADRDAAARLLKRLAASYPTSRLAKQVPDLLKKIESSVADMPALAVPAPAPIVAAQTTSPPTLSTLQAPATSRPLTAAPPPQAAASASAAGPAPAPAQAGRIATIKSIRRNVLPDAVRVVIELDAEVSFHQERIPDPSRVFVDLPGTRAAATLVDKTMRFESDADVVRQVRVGRHPNNTTRVVLDATGVSSYSVYPLYEPYRLVIDCVRTAATASAPAAAPPPTQAPTPVATTATLTAPPPPIMKPSPAPADRALPLPGAKSPQPLRKDPLPLIARRTAPGLLRSAPSNAPRHSVLIAEARALQAEPPALATRPLPPVPLSSPIAGPSPKPLEMASAPPPAEAPAAPPRPPTGGLSIARQLGLGVSRIVIDPGHGGHDSGAKGRGVVESELVLDVALRVEKLLQQTPGVEVILTRRTDDFIELPERTAMANREGADLFLSIHANASTSSLAHGIETYFLNFANNISAAAVAARENANSTQAMAALPDLVKAIALNNKLDESHDLAAHVQNAMVERLRPTNKTVKDLGVKQAPFVVLIGAVMPSVLAEISFVTNPQEARLLKNNNYRQRIAEALVEGIRKYQTSLKNAVTVATQR